MAELSAAGRLDGQKSIWVVGFAHGTTHWILATFFVVLPYVAQDLSLSYSQAGLLVSTYYASSFAANFVSGAAVDMTGRKILFLLLAVLAGAGAVIGFALSTSFLVLCLMMAIIGTTNSFWHPPAISFLSQEFPARRGYALSIHAFFASGADAFAPLVAGVIIAAAAWQDAIGSTAVPSLAAAAILLLLMPHDRPAADGTPRGLGGAHYRAGLMSLLRDRAVVGLCVMAGFRAMSQAGLLLFLPLYLANDLGVSPVTLGAALMAMQLGGMLAGPFAGIASDRIGRRPVVMAGLTLSTLIVLAITVIGHTGVFVAGISVLGFALFAVRPVIHSWMMDLVPPQLGASGTSLMFGAQSVLSTLTPTGRRLHRRPVGHRPRLLFPRRHHARREPHRPPPAEAGGAGRLNRPVLHWPLRYLRFTQP
ncbi:MFS transporter [Lutibaculum baratangense]|uniref:Major facilitator superfamily MFS_1 n=1 Tax=Lutibaculum baratangense AMV1 TaxID=631454 RepID=V4RD01_9HYPH|nr:MFS transporter [Lutibaculum baratangense]ESR24026.1 major facilitator superfamily MFS_1 [Lutibaculum baratangense AMV1]